MALVTEPYVVVLYGSRARGDHDDKSDVDLLAVGDSSFCSTHSAQWSGDYVSRYTWQEFEAMHAYGSLFLWHLKLQSRQYCCNSAGEAKYRYLMNTLPVYERAASDIAAFRLSLSDVREALFDFDVSYEDELACIASTVRHSCILGCYLLGIPEFGRYTAVRRFCDTAGLPDSIADEFPVLYKFRMKSERNIPLLTVGDFDHTDLEKLATDWLARSESVVKEVEACYMLSIA